MVLVSSVPVITAILHKFKVRFSYYETWRNRGSSWRWIRKRCVYSFVTEVYAYLLAYPVVYELNTNQKGG